MTDTPPSEDYDTDAVVDLIHEIFPRSTVEILQRLTGVPVRSVTRWVKGESRMPPTIVGKLRDQAKLRREFSAEIQKLVVEYAGDGAMRAVLRSALLEAANADVILEAEEL